MLSIAKICAYKKQVVQNIASMFGNDLRAIKHFDDLFIRWMFLASARGQLGDDFLPIDDESIVVMSDITFFVNKYRLKLSDDAVIDITYKRAANENGDGVDGNVCGKFDGDFIVYDKVRCPRVMWRMVLARYSVYDIDEAQKMHDRVSTLIRFYHSLGGLTNCASLPPNFIKSYKKPVELFGSPLNTCVDYCSVLRCEKEFFGSRGSFFDLEKLSEDETYIANPPFCEYLMLMMVEKLERLMTEKTKVIVIMPKWENFEAYDRLCKSKFCKSKTTTQKDTCKFYDYFSQKFIGIVDCYLLTLGDFGQNDAVHTKGKWIAFCK